MAGFYDGDLWVSSLMWSLCIYHIGCYPHCAEGGWDITCNNSLIAFSKTTKTKHLHSSHQTFFSICAASGPIRNGPLHTKGVSLWVKRKLLKAHREAKLNGIIISSLASIHPFSVNHRLFLISVPGRAGANPSSHLVRGRNLAHDLISHAHTSGQIRLSNQPNAQIFWDCGRKPDQLQKACSGVSWTLLLSISTSTSSTTRWSSG